jgi:hypothetical protein
MTSKGPLSYRRSFLGAEEAPLYIASLAGHEPAPPSSTMVLPI